MTHPAPWRRVLEVGDRRAGTVTFRLDCGHVAVRDASDFTTQRGMPKRARCARCQKTGRRRYAEGNGPLEP